MSVASDGAQVMEEPPPANWILQHPAVSEGGALCSVQGPEAESCSELCFFLCLVSADEDSGGDRQ